MAVIERLDFLGVPTQDPERSRAFYRGVLGLRPDEHAEWEQWAGDTCFGIWEPDSHRTSLPTDRGKHLTSFTATSRVARRPRHSLLCLDCRCTGTAVDAGRIGVMPETPCATSIAPGSSSACSCRPSSRASSAVAIGSGGMTVESRPVA